jgi:hypothetical protein
MVDSEHPDYFFCSPEGLLAQVQRVAQHMNVPLWGQNAILRFDEVLYMLLNCFLVSIFLLLMFHLDHVSEDFF